MERELTEALGTRVAIEPKEHGGKLAIDFASEDDLRNLFVSIAGKLAATAKQPASGYGDLPADKSPETASPSLGRPPTADISPAQELDDRSRDEIERDENTFDPSNFSI